MISVKHINKPYINGQHISIVITIVLIVLSIFLFSCNSNSNQVQDALNEEKVVLKNSVSYKDSLTIEDVLFSEVIKVDEFVQICSDTLIGSYFLMQVIDDYFETGELFIHKSKLLNIDLNLEYLFPLEIREEILDSLRKASTDIDMNEIYVPIQLNEEGEEFESSKIYYFKKEKDRWFFKGILIAG